MNKVIMFINRMYHTFNFLFSMVHAPSWVKEWIEVGLAVVIAALMIVGIVLFIIVPVIVFSPFIALGVVGWILHGWHVGKTHRLSTPMAQGSSS